VRDFPPEISNASNYANFISAPMRQFTFYFSKCGHATSHNYHRTPKSGENCNSNCIYDKNIDYWFWAGKDKRCSFCGLGQEHGFGTQHPIPENEGPRLLLFEKVKEGTTLEDRMRFTMRGLTRQPHGTIEGLWRRLVWQMQEPKNRFRIQERSGPSED